MPAEPIRFHRLRDPFGAFTGFARFPIVLDGRDVMGAAQTGTGKTAGFALPIIQKLLPHASASMSPARHPVRALILAPTRELADQTADHVK